MEAGEDEGGHIADPFPIDIRIEPQPLTHPNLDQALLNDALTSKDDLELVRLQHSKRNIGGGAKQSHYVYVFRNLSGTTAHSVIVLNPQSKGVQFNMNVTDAAGKSLVYLHSGLCAEFAFQYSAAKAREARAIWTKYQEYVRQEFILSEETLRTALGGPPSSPEGDRRQDEALSQALREVTGFISALPSDYLDAGHRRDGIYQALREDVRSFVDDLLVLEDLLSELLAFLEIHLDNYVPLVVLREPVAQAGQSDGSDFVIIKHTVQDSEAPLLASVPEQLAFFPLTVVRTLSAALGFHTENVDVELNPRPRSTHVPLSLSKGLMLQSVKCTNIGGLFQRDNKGHKWAKSDDKTYYFYRTREQIENYQAQGVDALKLSISVYEPWSAILLLLAIYGAAFTYGACKPCDADKARGLLGLLVSASLAYAAFAHDKPKILNTLALKIVAVALLVLHPEVKSAMSASGADVLISQYLTPATILLWTAVSFAGAWLLNNQERLTNWMKTGDDEAPDLL